MLGERYAEAGLFYISVLPRHHEHTLADFALEGAWQPVVDDPDREAVFARWADAKKAAQDPRQFVLLRHVGQTEPTRVYTGRFRPQTMAFIVPWLHRRRWPNNERRICDLINGANLNANYGYTYDRVPNRTRQRQWNEAQAQVEVTERKVSQHQEAIRNLRQQLAQLEQQHAQERTRWLRAMSLTQKPSVESAIWSWVTRYYFAPQWKNLSLDKATQMIYRKSGRVTGYPDRIEVRLDAYAYRDQQQAMEATCRRFNDADLRWRDGRLLHIHVADP